MSSSQRVSCGIDFYSAPDINGCLGDASDGGFDFCCVPIVHPRYKREFIEGPAVDRSGPLTRSDLLLTSQDWTSLIVGKISPWIDLDSEVEDVRKNSEKAFQQELAFATHLSLPAVLMSLKSARCFNFARFLAEYTVNGPNQQLWIHVPMKAPKEQCDDIFEDTEGQEGWKEDTWHWWNNFRTLCDFNKKVGIALEITADLPDPDILDRWCGEPVKAAILSTDLFLRNKKGFPVLSRPHQAFVKRLYQLDVQMIITGHVMTSEKGPRAYHQYMQYLYENRMPPSDVDLFGKGYEDYLQCPLQPLMDNLESQTYETFEKDNTKYTQYQKAIYYALLDRVLPQEKEDKVIVVMVVGAGRGPLVRAALTASAQADRKIRVYAVEKNPNAVVTLENMKCDIWGDQVTVVSSDMREWNAPEKADIIVSELLGSFSDNELSPECLDGVQKFMKDDGISIPKEYTSYIAPVQSSKLFNEVRMCRDKDKHPDVQFETPYVVRLHNCFLLGGPVPVFRFHHPNKGIIDNTRYKSMEFRINHDSVLHGFGGYFETILYGNITLSTNPDTHTPNMFSWFPILFPVKEPVYLKKGDTLEVHFWRRLNAKNVWYEWCVTKPRVYPILNSKARSNAIGL